MDEGSWHFCVFHRILQLFWNTCESHRHWATTNYKLAACHILELTLDCLRISWSHSQSEPQRIRPHTQTWYSYLERSSQATSNLNGGMKEWLSHGQIQGTGRLDRKSMPEHPECQEWHGVFHLHINHVNVRDHVIAIIAMFGLESDSWSLAWVRFFFPQSMLLLKARHCTWSYKWDVREGWNVKFASCTCHSP